MERPRVLVVHRRSPDLPRIRAALGPDYQLQELDDPRAVLRCCLQPSLPALVLFEVATLPQGGFEGLGLLRADARTRVLPILFFGEAPAESVAGIDLGIDCDVRRIERLDDLRLRMLSCLGAWPCRAKVQANHARTGLLRNDAACGSPCVPPLPTGSRTRSRSRLRTPG